MNPDQRKELETRFDEAIAQTQKDIAALIDLTKPISPENAIGRISRMDAINNKSVNEASLRKTQAKLINLEKAFKKINNDDFGFCVQCKLPIPLGRIMLMPQSTKCVNCAR